ncbi:MAG: hypothetical protein GF355_01055, partial [Candidatus Eisenbacteria bacterium]|nr:hypothetical protein [Candidatus Eisenbacteria bacterium]
MGRSRFPTRLFLLGWLAGSLWLGWDRAAAEPFAATRARDLRPRITAVEGRVSILTRAALYRFDPSSEAWTITAPQDGLPKPPLDFQSVSAGQHWIGGSGVSYSDARLEDWQRFVPGEGFPATRVTAVEADGDYAYAATDSGAARYDQYILEWEPLPGNGGRTLGPVNDLALGDERVWFALQNGVAEYRKQAESVRVDTLLGQLTAPEVLALRPTQRYLWALTPQGIARYDKELESWMSFPVGADLPDARVHQMTLVGDDLWLGTDDGLWRFRSDVGIWRRDEASRDMPGRRVLAFAVESERFWIVTEKAFAVYDRSAARWIDYTGAVPADPAGVVDMAWLQGTFVVLSDDHLTYGLSGGRRNPSLFTYRTRPLAESPAAAPSPETDWQVGVDEAGLRLQAPRAVDLLFKGGATIFAEDQDTGSQDEPGLGEIVSESRWDLVMSGRVGAERTLSGIYDTTDPDNSIYQLTYRGAREDLLRVVELGEIEQELFNARLAPGTGLRGGHARFEAGERSAETRRRLVTADAWAGERRTLPGRDVYQGGNRTVTGRLRDVDYAQRQVFPLPAVWTPAELRGAHIYRDDGRRESDDANTEERILAGRPGAWDRLIPNQDYVLGRGGATLILTAPLPEDGALAAVAGASGGSSGEHDLTEAWLRNHYWIAVDPVPGSLRLSIQDTTGSTTDPAGRPYSGVFGLDADGDGGLDPERFSPVTGYLDFPDSLPFPTEVYYAEPRSLFELDFTYRTELNTFRLSHDDVIRGSERITIDREPLQAGTDYALIPASGLFIFFEHVLLDDDAIIEVDYLYEIGAGAGEDREDIVYAGQLGLAPHDQLFVGAGAARWRDAGDRRITTLDGNARLEWRGARHFLRMTPEAALSTADDPPSGEASQDKGRALGIGVQGRYRSFEAFAAHRSLGAAYRSFENRQTLLGRLREDSEAWARWRMHPLLQAELEWDRALSDQVAPNSDAGRSPEAASAGGLGGARRRSEARSPAPPAGGWGEESSLMGTLRLLRAGWPNLAVRRGRVLIDAPGSRREKWISRAELELNPARADVAPLGIRRLWLRAFLQRSTRELSGTAVEDSLGASGALRRVTDHAFIRLNGTLGTPLSWNAAFEDRRTHLPETEPERDVQRVQRLDATLQGQPHPGLDAYVRWEAERDLFWNPEGRTSGFKLDRYLLATLQVYPGRIWQDAWRVSFRFDFSQDAREDGEPGVKLPATSGLWRRAESFARHQRTRSGIGEARVQLAPWLRLVERLERERDRTNREGLTTEAERWQWENRFEIRSRGGLVTLRFIGSESEDDPGPYALERRFSGQWDQIWGGGFLTYLSLEAERNEERLRHVGAETHFWNPQLQLTWRRPWWRLDATLVG